MDTGAEQGAERLRLPPGGVLVHAHPGADLAVPAANSFQAAFYQRDRFDSLIANVTRGLGDVGKQVHAG